MTNKQIKDKLLSDKIITAATKAHCDHHVGKTNSIWDSLMTNQSYRKEEMRSAMEAVVNIIFKKD